MAIPILQTKLHLPKVPPKIVQRAHLVDHLNEGLHRKVTLIAAQAGAGKTTLASVWLRRLDHDVAWLSVDEADSEPTRFWLYVIAAVQTVRPQFGRAMQTMLEGLAVPPYEILLTGLLNEIVDSPDRLILVLDDYHHITNGQTHETVAFVLDHLPPQLHLVLITREDPPLPLARYRVQQQITELRFSQLHFTTHEAGQFLNQTMGLHLQTGEIETLTQRTEGWAAGLQLAALSLQHQLRPADFIDRFAGDDRYLVDYLVTEVLEQQPPELRMFLLKTAVLGRFTASLCDAVTDRSDSRRVLTQLEYANLFLIPLDNRRQWFRFHRLFRDLLYYRLLEESEDLRPLHSRAGDWHTSHGNLDEAVHHYLAAEQYVRAADQIEPVGISRLVRGQLRQVLDWLAAFPGDFLTTRPFLCVFQAWALNISGRAADVEHWLEVAQKALDRAPTAQQQEIRGLIRTVQSYLARNRNDITQSMNLLRQALTDLSDENLLVRSTVNLNLGFNYAIVGELALADQALAAAVAESQRCQAIYVLLIAMAVRGNVYAAQGRLAAAKQLYQEAIDQGLEESGGTPFPPAGYACAGLGQVLYEQNQQAVAEEHLQQAVIYGEQIGDWSMMRRGLLPLAWLRQIQGDWDAAEALWQRAFSVVKQAESDRIAAQLKVHRTRLWLARAGSTTGVGSSAGLAAAEAWAAAYERSGTNPLSYPESLAQQTLAWLDFLRGELDRALSRLEPLAQAAEAGGHGDNLVKILALTALVHDGRGDRGSALAFMRRALASAVPQGYVRTFIDLGLPIRRFLQLPEVTDMAPTYIAQLLQAFEAAPPRSKSSDEPSLAPLQQSTTGAPALSESSSPPAASHPLVLVEPLNERERQILGRMAARHSNQRIADELHLSINTVKWHARNLYAKLDVAGRVEAIDRARELQLL